jgi:hypothetical protein
MSDLMDRLTEAAVASGRVQNRVVTGASERPRSRRSQCAKTAGRTTLTTQANIRKRLTLEIEAHVVEASPVAVPTRGTSSSMILTSHRPAAGRMVVVTIAPASQVVFRLRTGRRRTCIGIERTIVWVTW